MTEQELEEAKQLFRFSKLSEAEKSYYQELQRVKSQMEHFELLYTDMQKSCPHPLVMRDTKNEGSTGGWDRDSDSFWTVHNCNLCGLRWWTNQRWKYISNGLGLPTDKEACNY